MTHYNYLIVGGGMTAAAAIEGIREEDGAGSIGVITSELQPPYDRPPLSKQLWTGSKTVDTITRPVVEEATFHFGRRVENVNPGQKEVVDDLGNVYGYEKLMLATGGTPRRLPFGGDDIIYYRTLDTYHRLRDLSAKFDRFAVIGGGFIGSEIAAALALNGKKVTMLFPEEGIAARLFPGEVAEFLNGYYREKGVEVLNGEMVDGLEGSGTDLTVITKSGRRIDAEGVVAGIGIVPNVELAEKAGLDVDDGIVVNASLQTSDESIYAAGDVARFHDAILDARRRVEHEDAANSMGKAAGRAMAGAQVEYDYSPMFYSDLFDLGYEAVGELDSRLETVVDWQEPFEKGVVYYLSEGRVRGVLLWNVWGKMDEARQLIAGGESVRPSQLKGRIA